MASLFASKIFEPIKALSVIGGIMYIFVENIKKTDIHPNISENRIKKMICTERIKQTTPEEIFALQFNENKRNVYEKLVKYPGTIINCGLVPVSIGCMFAGSGGFGIGCCLMYLVLYSDIVNNNISKILNKKNLIINEKDFLTLRDISYTYHMMTFDTSNIDRL
jgi:hypothetical protein